MQPRQGVREYHETDESEWFELDKYRKSFAAGSLVPIDDSWLWVVPAKLHCLLLDPVVEVIEGDCLDVLTQLSKRTVDLVIFNPPLLCDVSPYGFPVSSHNDYLAFVIARLDASIRHLTPTGVIWANVSEDIAAEVVMHLKNKGLHMISWGIGHYSSGVSMPAENDPVMESKTHCLYFAKNRKEPHLESVELPNRSEFLHAQQAPARSLPAADH